MEHLDKVSLWKWQLRTQLVSYQHLNPTNPALILDRNRERTFISYLKILTLQGKTSLTSKQLITDAQACNIAKITQTENVFNSSLPVLLL